MTENIKYKEDDETTDMSADVAGWWTYVASKYQMPADNKIKETDGLQKKVSEEEQK